MTFSQVPSRGGLSDSEAGRVEPIYDQAQLIFVRIVNEEPVVVKKANNGFGAIMRETGTLEPDSAIRSSAG